jgi:large subunit ribosomal protein L16
MLKPKKVKFRKSHRGRMTGMSKGARTVDFGQFGLEALEPAWITSQQIEALRVTVARKIKKGGKFFLRMFPDKPVSKKPLETRMGKGKGNPEFWVAVVKRGRVICELGDVDEVTAKDIFKQASFKLPIKTKFVRKEV